MPYINYCKQCGTPVRYSGRQWVHYRDHDHAPEPVSVRMRAPIDSINEAIKRDEPSITNIVSRANAYIGSGAFDVWCDLFDLLLADKDKTVEFMLDPSVEERYKTECLMVLAGGIHGGSYSELAELWRELWKSDKLPNSLRATLEWLHDVRHIQIKTPTDKLLDTQGW